MLFALLQETTANLADDATKVGKGMVEEPLSIYSTLREFLQRFSNYILSTDFVGDALASVLVAFLGVLVFRILTRGVPQILRWRRRDRESLLDEEAVARVKRQDTAITLIRNALRYVVFIIVVLVILSIFFNNPLPAVAGTTIIAAVIGFGAQSFLRGVIARSSIVVGGPYRLGAFGP